MSHDGPQFELAREDGDELNAKVSERPSEEEESLHVVTPDKQGNREGGGSKPRDLARMNTLKVLNKPRFRKATGLMERRQKERLSSIKVNQAVSTNTYF
jgi:hypothetical protein